MHKKFIQNIKKILLLLLAVLFIVISSQGQNKKAISSDVKKKIDSLQLILQKHNKDTAYTNISNSIAKEYNQAGDYANAVEFSQKALSNAELLKYTKGKANALLNLADTYRKKKEFSQSQENLQLARQSFEQLQPSDKKNYTKGKAECLHMDALLFKSQGKPDNALETFKLVIEFCIKENEKEVLARAYNNIGQLYYEKSKYEEAIKYYKNAQEIKSQLNDKKGEGISLNNIANVYLNLCNYDKATLYFQQAYDNFVQVGYTDGIVVVLNSLGVINDNQGNYDVAINYLQKALQINEKYKDEFHIAESLNNIGNIYSKMEKPQDALQYQQKALEQRLKINDKKGLIQSYNNVGLCLCRLVKEKGKAEFSQNQKKAIESYELALNILDSLDNPFEKAKTLHNIGESHEALNDFKKAIQYFNNALEIRTKIKHSGGISSSAFELGKSYSAIHDIVKAEYYLLMSYNISKELNEKKDIFQVSQALYELYKKENKLKEALQFCENYTFYKDSVLGEKTQKIVNELQTKYETGKKEQQIKLLDSEKKLQDTKIKQQMYIISGFIFGFLIILVFSFVIYRQFQGKKKANLLLAKQNILLEEQKKEIEEIHMELTDSIHYAQRIQNAVLPDIQLSKMMLADSFILFKPRNIVSGDFYWMTIKKNWLLVAVADCTGHGVPGAFMSMLGVSFLNEIVSRDDVNTASQVLNELREYVINSLQQKGVTGEQKDGMDISFAAIDLETYVMQYAGANNSLYIVSKQLDSDKSGITQLQMEFQSEDKSLQLLELKPDKMPIGIHEQMKPFTNNTIQLYKEDTIYLFSDGYQDQFGGSKGRKFLSKQLKQMMIDYADKSMPEQKEIFDKTIEQWKQYKQPAFEQTDDITALGIRIWDIDRHSLHSH